MRVLAFLTLAPLLMIAPNLLQPPGEHAHPLPLDDDRAEPAAPAFSTLHQRYELRVGEAGALPARASGPFDNCVALAASHGTTIVRGELRAAWDNGARLELAFARGDEVARVNGTGPLSLRVDGLALAGGDEAARILVQQPRDALGFVFEPRVALDVHLVVTDASLAERVTRCSVE